MQKAMRGIAFCMFETPKTELVYLVRNTHSTLDFVLSEWHLWSDATTRLVHHRVSAK
jgi:hypothetical protein